MKRPETILPVDLGFAACTLSQSAHIYFGTWQDQCKEGLKKSPVWDPIGIDLAHATIPSRRDQNGCPVYSTYVQCVRDDVRLGYIRVRV